MHRVISMIFLSKMFGQIYKEWFLSLIRRAFTLFMCFGLTVAYNCTLHNFF